ncbi:PSD1 and planctomycete cytochrome C domain-containing protein [soil metagenome]
MTRTGISLIAAVSCVATAVGDPLPWSLSPLRRPAVPETGHASPIDSFVVGRLAEDGLGLSPPADRPTWLRRVSFDLIGLPPSPAEVAAFVDDRSPGAEEALVDRLLASPRHGERWARHWMDVVRYAETHGHDEDAIRENAWPYRDWLIRALNDDMPYAEFVRMQVAGDVIAPGDASGVVATGFLACGPWDASSQMGIQDGTTDKRVAQYLDRDDMLSATMSAFTSTTVHCARCHDHKFDPVSLEDYYALQAVFAGVDKIDRPFDHDPAVARRRADLGDELRRLEAGTTPGEGDLDPALRVEVEAWASGLEAGARQWSVMVPDKVDASGASGIEILPDGAVLFRGDPPDKDTYTVSGSAGMDRVTGLQLEVLSDPSLPAHGPGRAPNGNLHLSEISVRIGGNSIEIERAAAGFNQDGWEIDKAVDGNPESAWGIHPRQGEDHRAVFVFGEAGATGEGDEGGVVEVVLEQLHGGSHLIGKLRVSLSSHEAPDAGMALPAEIREILALPEAQRSPGQTRSLAAHYLKERAARQLAALPEPDTVYAVASAFPATGNFKPAGQHRPIHVLDRGDIHSPLGPALPGALGCVPGLPARFELPDPTDEGARRAALADWLAHPDNVLTWRSIANRVWHYHFGRGIVATPDDFGKMGAAPSHPELLDWLAAGLRSNDGSLKWLHKEIVLSATYRQAADERPDGLAADPENRLLWRMPSRRLDAECVRDAVLSLSGMLDLRMGGPSDRQFHTSPGVHVTPVVDYLGLDPDDPANFRRSVYRFVFRTVPDPLMQALDCPDASHPAPRRETSATSLQALALRNNPFLVRQAAHLATDLERGRDGLAAQVDELFLRAYARPPTGRERAEVAAYAAQHGLANACRIILNTSEFLFVH